MVIIITEVFGQNECVGIWYNRWSLQNEVAIGNRGVHMHGLLGRSDPWVVVKKVVHVSACMCALHT